MAKIKQGDKVIVIAGKDKNRVGEVLKVIKPKPAEKKKLSFRVIVKGMRLVKKAVRRNVEAGIDGGHRTKEMSMDISNVAIFNPLTQRADRVGYKFLETGKKVRIFKSNGELIDIE